VWCGTRYSVLYRLGCEICEMIWSWCGTKYIVLYRLGCEICEMMWSVWCGTRYIVLNRLGCEMMWRGECVVLGILFCIG